MAKVLIVDDHPIVREGLIQLINHRSNGKLTVVEQADNAQTALNAVANRKPDIVILDVFLKDTNGIELIKQIKKNHAQTVVLMLSMHDESLYAERALCAGADGYIMKTETPSNIMQAIQHVLKGGIYISDQMATKFIKRDTIRRTSKNVLSINLLASREREVFHLLGIGKTTRQIAQELNLSVKTVETYRGRIKQKLQITNTNELIQQAVQWVDSRHSE